MTVTALRRPGGQRQIRHARAGLQCDKRRGARGQRACLPGVHDPPHWSIHVRGSHADRRRGAI